MKNTSTTALSQKTVSLIKGEFEATDAAEIVLTLLRNKIKFHQSQIFSFEERGIGDIEYSKQRVKELQQAKNDLTDVLVEARQENKRVTITSDINIEIL